MIDRQKQVCILREVVGEIALLKKTVLGKKFVVWLRLRLRRSYNFLFPVIMGLIRDTFPHHATKNTAIM